MNTLFFKIRLLALITLLISTNIAISKTYGPIKANEKLWNIAYTIRSDKSISRIQALLAILKANPQAFYKSCNINSLKSNQTLIIPSRAEMLALTVREASKEFVRQNKEWNNSQNIICPTIVEEKAAISKPEPIAPPVPKVEDKQLVKTKTESIKQWFEKQELPRIMGIVTIAILLLLAFLISRKKQLLTDDKSEINNFSDYDPKEKMPLTGGAAKANKQKPLASLKNPYDEIKDKLENVRTYLAGDDARRVQGILRDVIQEGNSEQQIEAKQLYKIIEQVNGLKKKVDIQQSNLLEARLGEDDPSWKEIVKKGQQMSTSQFLPENSDGVFKVIDKIFDLLDYELNARGKLIEAYTNRYQNQQQTEIDEYKSLKKRAVANDIADSATEQKISQQATRYL
ncbi:FimV/HubP family polar landmark protein [Candidatus Marithrix sp. Canyon 246]|uniref:FimV/HubP family polar landmark protein n=1 Tax=Candidatus Marithrix sp. Canyon 246 TaxID=1827136 RepID=UPI000849F4F6|nr:FimV/HubP family polar landmark protein [Candidatus Marithrix sp. Canyon 246]